jgi:hypothetical protein
MRCTVHFDPWGFVPGKRPCSTVCRGCVLSYSSGGPPGSLRRDLRSFGGPGTRESNAVRGVQGSLASLALGGGLGPAAALSGVGSTIVIILLICGSSGGGSGGSDTWGVAVLPPGAWQAWCHHVVQWLSYYFSVLHCVH